MKIKVSYYFFPILLLFCLSALAQDKTRYPHFEKVFTQLTVETREERKIKLSELKTELVVVNFWASWCIPCLEELPSFIKFSQKYTREQLTILAINTDEDDQIKNVLKIEKNYSIPSSFTIILDNKFTIADQFQFKSIPVTIIYKKGKVIFFNDGPTDFLNRIPPLL